MCFLVNFVWFVGLFFEMLIICVLVVVKVLFNVEKFCVLCV